DDRRRDAMSVEVVGQPLDRRDGRLKVTGGARYSAEMPVDDVAYGVLVMSTVGAGRIAAIDVGDAAGRPGVLHGLTHLNATTLDAQNSGRGLTLLRDDTVY